MAIVCLIIPPSRFLTDERVFPQLGILSVASALLRAGVAIEVLDLSSIENYLEVVRNRAAMTNARFFGITATTPQMPAAEEIRSEIQTRRPDAIMVLGGPHVTLTGSSKSYRSVDAMAYLRVLWHHLIIGDGEHSMVNLVLGKIPTDQCIIDGSDPASALWAKPEDILPARELIDLSSYEYEIDGFKATSVISQLGCPFQCNFCAGRLSPNFRRLRIRTIESVVTEIESLYREYGFRGFMFYDDELNLTKRLIDLMNSLSKLQNYLGVDFRFRGFVKSELFTIEQAQSMYRAGFRWILTGIESGSDRILKNIGKQATVADNDRFMEICRSAGLKVKACMSIGHAGETEETCQETLDWILRNRPDDFDVTVVSLYPGSAYYDQAARCQSHSACDVYEYIHPKTGDKLYSTQVDHTRVVDFYKGDPDKEYRPHVFTEALSSAELAGERAMIEREGKKALGISMTASKPKMLVKQEGLILPDYIYRRCEP
jgi:anaerobic magnesium-protoporphyrin IX monomethyl ester cyclase